MAPVGIILVRFRTWKGSSSHDEDLSSLNESKRRADLQVGRWPVLWITAALSKYVMSSHLFESSI